jgi:hypothetical protein
MRRFIAWLWTLVRDEAVTQSGYWVAGKILSASVTALGMVTLMAAILNAPVSSGNAVVILVFGCTLLFVMYALRDRFEVPKQPSSDLTPDFLVKKEREEIAKLPDISWSFDDPESTMQSPLGLASSSGQETYVWVIQARGRNNGDRLTHVSGFIRSNKTGDEYPLGLVVNGQVVKPEATSGIPGGGDFLTMTWPLPSDDPKRNGGIRVSKFLYDFPTVTFVFKYGDKRYEREFSNKELIDQLQKYERWWLESLTDRLKRQPSVRLKDSP